MAETNSPAHFSFLSTHYSPPNHTSLPTLPQTQRYLPTAVPLLQPCPQPGTPRSPLVPCLANPTPLLVLSSQASPGGGLLPPERRLTRWHSGLLGPDDILPWWSVGCPPICLPSLQPPKQECFKSKTQDDVIDLSCSPPPPPASGPMPCSTQKIHQKHLLLEYTSQFHARLQQQTNKYT